MKDKKVLSLVKKASKRDEAAFTQLCELKVREVLFLCVREMGSAQDGQDAAQEVFIQMQKSIARLRAPEAFNVWLNRLVHHTCQTMKRDDMKHKQELNAESFEDFMMDETLSSLPQENLESDETRLRIMELIDSMPEKYRTPVVLHYYQNLSYREISEVMGITADAVNNNMRMARKYLRRGLEGDLPRQAVEKQPAAGGMAVPMLALGPLLTNAMVQTAARATPALLTGCLAAAGVSATAAGIGAGAATAAAGFAAKTIVQVAAISAVALAGAGIAVGTATGRIHWSSIPPPAVSQASGPPQSPGLAAAAGGEDTPALSVGNTLSGRVYLRNSSGADPEAFTGLGDAVVELVADSEPDTVLQIVYTEDGAADGAFLLEDVPDGRCRIRVTLPGSAVCTKGGAARIQGGLKTVQTGWLELDGSTVFEVSGGKQLAGLDIEVDLDARLSGHIQLELNGVPIDYDEEYLPGVYIQLLDPQQKVVAQAPISPTGEYLFEKPMISQSGAYTLHIECEEAAGVALDIPDAVVNLEPGSRA